MTDSLFAFILSLRSLLKASVLVVGARVVGGIIGLASQVLIARLLGAESLGIYFMALSLAAVLSIVFSVGYPWIVARFVAGHEPEGKASNLTLFLTNARRDIAFTSVFGIFLIGPILLFLPSLSQNLMICLLIGIFTAPVFAYMKLNIAYANAQKKYMLAYLPDLFFRPLSMLVLIAIFWALPGQLNIVWLVAGHLVIVLFLTVFQLWTLGTGPVRDKVTLDRKNLKKTEQVGKGVRRQWRAHALPMIIATLFVTTFADLDLVLISFFLPERELAIFGASLKIALFLAFAIQAVHQLILRDLADAIKSKEEVLISKIMTQTNVLAIFLSLAALLITIFFGNNVLMIFGREFSEGYDCLIILVLAQVIRAIAGPATQILTLTSNERFSLPVFGGNLVLLVVANMVLVPLFQLTGAALAVLIVTMSWSMGLAVVTFIKTGITTTVLPIRKLRFIP